MEFIFYFFLAVVSILLLTPFLVLIVILIGGLKMFPLIKRVFDKYFPDNQDNEY